MSATKTVPAPRKADHYGDGCEEGRRRATLWMEDPLRGDPQAGGTLCDHVFTMASRFAAAMTEAERHRARGEIVGFCYAIECPSDVTAGLGRRVPELGHAVAGLEAEPLPDEARHAIDSDQVAMTFFEMSAEYTIAPGTNLHNLIDDFECLQRSGMGAIGTCDDFTDAQWAGIYVLRQASGIFQEIARRVLAGECIEGGAA